jgi:hypothetical protein
MCTCKVFSCCGPTPARPDTRADQNRQQLRMHMPARRTRPAAVLLLLVVCLVGSLVGTGAADRLGVVYVTNRAHILELMPGMCTGNVRKLCVKLSLAAMHMARRASGALLRLTQRSCYTGTHTVWNRTELSREAAANRCTQHMKRISHHTRFECRPPVSAC